MTDNNDEPRLLYNGWLGREMVMRPSELQTFAKEYEEAKENGTLGQFRFSLAPKFQAPFLPAVKVLQQPQRAPTVTVPERERLITSSPEPERFCLLRDKCWSKPTSAAQANAMVVEIMSSLGAGFGGEKLAEAIQFLVSQGLQKQANALRACIR